MPQEARIFVDGSTGGRLPYLLFLPLGYGADRARRWPVILFLHGSGERGTDPGVLKGNGIPRHVEEKPRFPFVTVSPQCPPESTWGRQIPKVEALLTEVLETCAVDPDRVYLTGLSMGGNGAWLLGARSPERFAAVAPICGYGLDSRELREGLCALRDTPVWAFHGGKDPVVSPHESRRLVAALEACGGEARYTEYPRSGHDAWTRTYRDPELYRWFLSHRRGAREAARSARS